MKIPHLPEAISHQWSQYPEKVQEHLQSLRRFIYTCAFNEGIKTLDETLKWGQASYKAPSGSAVRIDWKGPKTYMIYYHCQSKLGETFRTLYGEVLEFEGQRAIILDLDSDWPQEIVAHCISLAMRYHQIKHLSHLGA